MAKFISRLFKLGFEIIPEIILPIHNQLLLHFKIEYILFKSEEIHLRIYHVQNIIFLSLFSPPLIFRY